VSSDEASMTNRGAHRQRTMFAALAFVLISSVASLSFLPYESKQVLHTRGRFHSWGHLLVFSVIAYLVARVARSLRARVLLFVIALAFGFGIEVTEHLVFHGVLEWKDVAVDALGVAGGTLLAIISAPEEVDSTVLG
jgi:hypothetical protein